MSILEKRYEEGMQIGRREGIKEGIQEGLQEGRREKSLHYAIKLLTKKFGRLPENYRAKIENADIETLDLIIEEIFALESLHEIDKYL